ncbi:hypothetical protein C8R44DRAFT_728205 [Mycena epipterygia]|nr:hypothetical protein C8R44DRAFT_728205 [Mycena epipterygia]
MTQDVTRRQSAYSRLIRQAAPLLLSTHRDYGIGRSSQPGSKSTDSTAQDEADHDVQGRKSRDGVETGRRQRWQSALVHITASVPSGHAFVSCSSCADQRAVCPPLPKMRPSAMRKNMRWGRRHGTVNVGSRKSREGGVPRWILGVWPLGLRCTSAVLWARVALLCAHSAACVELRAKVTSKAPFSYVEAGTSGKHTCLQGTM